MKRYEHYSQIQVHEDIPLIVRLDGRSFSNFTKKLKLIKPFDERLKDIFINVSQDLMNEFQPKRIYTFSDEINIHFENIIYNGRIEKIDSVLSSFASASFMKHLILNKDSFELDIEKLKPVSFDCRIIQTCHVKEYFRWRQDEAWRNCLNGYAQFMLSKQYSPEITAKKLYKLNKSEINELLYENGININEVPTWHKRGICVYKIISEKEGIDPRNNKKNISKTSKVYIDLETKRIKLK